MSHGTTRAPGRPGARLATVLLAALAVMVLLTGCVTQQGGTTGKLGRAAAEVESSLTSAELGLDQERAGLTLPGAVDTLLENMLKDVNKAAAKMGKLSPKTTTERDQQRRALELAGEAEQALATARANLQLPGTAPGTSAASDIEQLAKLADTIGHATEGWSR
ncbi:hypothetical protein [Arthrobacter sp. JSM 101049]|uniref:hypothetical protein n=1 Tax=Arthrobacter sp. JSM 101049 TaxID=929097 RepID=UPI00356B0875